MKKISIIVPIYNVEAYLEKCLDSLVNQTLKNIEIILVNDGSTDSSYEIASIYEKKYKNVSLYTHDNRGLSYTRNIGLKYATADYIMFIDSDDYLDNDACEKLYNYATSMEADIVTFDLKYVYTDNTVSFMHGGKRPGKLDTHEYMIGASSAASKMYKREFLDSINFKFKEGIWSEDIAIIPLLSIYTDKIYYLSEVSYNYIQHNNSITNQISYNPKSLDAISSLEIFESIIKEKNKYDEFKSEIEYIYITNLLLTLPLKVYKYKEGKKDIKRMSNIMSIKFPNWRKNKYYKNELTKKQKIYVNLFYYKLPNIVKFLYIIKNKIVHK